MAASTTILSALHNSGINDIVNMLNTPWPLSVGLGVAGQIGSWDALTAKGTTVASSSTLVLTTATGPRIDISGTTSITAVTLADGTMRFARATGIFTLTAGASLLVNGSATVSYTTKVGDILIFQADGSVISVTTLTPLGIETIALAPSANQNDYATGASPNAAKGTVIVISPTASVILTGISTTGWETGKPVTIRNGTSRTAASGRLIILVRNSASSSAANRFQIPKSNYDFAPLFLMPGEEANFRFDGTDLKFAGMGKLNVWDNIVTRNGTFSFSTVNGTGATVTGDNVETDSNGFIVPYYEPVTGTTNTGCCGVRMGTAADQFVFGAGCVLEVSRVNVPTLSTAGEEFDCWCGFNDVTSLGVITDGVGWRYDRNTSVNWQTYSRSNGTETLNATASAVTTGRYDSLGVFVNGDASRVDYFYSTDGGETWTIFGTAITTNIPSGAARATMLGAGILKSAGTTSRAFREMSSWMRWLR